MFICGHEYTLYVDYDRGSYHLLDFPGKVTYMEQRVGRDLGLSYNSCRNRHCPKCQAQARRQWTARQKADLVPLPYFHVVFTVPHQLSALMLQNKRTLYSLGEERSREGIFARRSANQGAPLGFLHCVVRERRCLGVAAVFDEELEC